MQGSFRLSRSAAVANTPIVSATAAFAVKHAQTPVG